MMKKAKIRLCLAAAVCALLLMAGLTEVHAAPGAVLAGSWRVTVEPDSGGEIPNLVVIQRDGLLTNWDPAFGTGVGIWRRAADREYVLKFVHLTPSPNGLPPGTERLVVRGLVKVENGGAIALGSFVTSFVDANGDLLSSFSGTVRLDRISMD